MEKSSGYGIWRWLADVLLTGTHVAIIKWLWPLARMLPPAKIPSDEQAWIKINISRMLVHLPAQIATAAFFIGSFFLIWKLRRRHWLYRLKWAATAGIVALKFVVTPGPSLIHAVGAQAGWWPMTPINKAIEMSQGLEQLTNWFFIAGSWVYLAGMALLFVGFWVLAVFGMATDPKLRESLRGHSMTQAFMASLHTLLFLAIAILSISANLPDPANLAILAFFVSFAEFSGCLPEEMDKFGPSGLRSWAIAIVGTITYLGIVVATTVILLLPYAPDLGSVRIYFAW